MVDVGLFVARIVFGLMIAAHGAQKLFGWFGGYGLAAVTGYFETLGFKPGRPFAFVAAASEVIGGLLVALGLFGPIGPALMLAVMIVAAFSVHWANGLFATANGIELPLLYATAAVTLTLTGFGAHSLDALLGFSSLSAPPVAWGALVVGIVGGLVNLAIRRPVTV